MDIINLVQNKLNELIGKEINVKNLQQRGIADRIEDIASTIIHTLSDKEVIVESATSKRSMEDIQIVTPDKLFKFDTKSHDVDSEFSMPNLVSIDRLKRFYQSDNNFLVYIFIDYKVVEEIAQIIDVKVKLIEELDWSILAIQNLGKGQLQIKNMNSDLVFGQINRKEWLEELSKHAIAFCDNLLAKTKRYRKIWE